MLIAEKIKDTWITCFIILQSLLILISLATLYLELDYLILSSMTYSTVKDSTTFQSCKILNILRTEDICINVCKVCETPLVTLTIESFFTWIYWIYSSHDSGSMLLEQYQKQKSL